MIRETKKSLCIPGILLTALLLFFAPRACADCFYGGKYYPESAEYIDLESTVVKDYDAFVDFLDQMPNLKRVDMWETKIRKDEIVRLADRYPGIRWGWTMVLKTRDHEHLIRTDSTSFSTLHNNTSSHHTSEDFFLLKYCWNLLALDVGHNSVDSLDFLYDLPNLRVLILACNNITDITPLASLKDLEYLELFKNKITDLSPLSSLEHLLDLNVCFNAVKDLSPIAGLHTLKRLFLYSSMQYNKSPAESAVQPLLDALPDTEIDTTHYSTAGTWRYIRENKIQPHYEAILAMFGADHQHPKNQYVPFEESQPLPAQEEIPLPLSTPLPAPDASPETGVIDPMERLKTQSFEDKNYLLPIDFSVGKTPKAENYTETSYQDSTISVSLSSDVYCNCHYWVADIQISDPSQLRTMSAALSGSFERPARVNAQTLMKRTDAVLAINGDTYSSTGRANRGFAVRQGLVYRTNLDRLGPGRGHLMDVLLIDEDGDFHVVFQASDESILPSLLGKRILNAFSFGPVLVYEGKAVEDFQNADKWIDMSTKDGRKRMCLCQVGPLHYKVLCCAGFYGGDAGLTLPQLAALAESLGVETAYNLDGGDSTYLYFNGRKFNDIGNNSQRKLEDVIYFASAEE